MKKPQGIEAINKYKRNTLVSIYRVHSRPMCSRVLIDVYRFPNLFNGDYEV